MKKYFDSVQDRAGNALQGASVAVLNYPALTPATIFTGNGVGLIAGNVLTTDVRGYFEFYAADGHYTLSISGTGITPQTVNDVLIEDPADANPSVVSTLLATLGITLSTLTLGSVLFAGAAGAITQDNANFFWDNTNKRLGIGNAAPTVALDVTGVVKATYFQPTGVASAPGAISFESNFLVLQGGASGLQVRDSGDANTNLQITDAGVATFRTSVLTPIVSSAGNLLIQTPGGGALQLSSGTGVVSCNSDNTTIFGDATHRWITGFFTSIDSGTGGSLFLRTGNGNNSFEVIQAGAGAVNWWGVSGQATGITPFISVRGETNIGGVLQGNRGTGTFRINDGTTNVTVFEFLSTPAATRWITSAASNGGNPTLDVTAGAIRLSSGTADIQWGKANVALGGGAAPTFGTIGGTGPAAAAQRNWLRFIESDGTASFIPVWR